MKKIQITPAGAIISDAQNRIPELARVSLDRFTNNKFKELNLVTKAFKYRFPFYDKYQQKRAFNKFFDLIGKALVRNIPYLAEAKVPFVQIPLLSQDGVVIKIGPYPRQSDADRKQIDVLARYIRYITYLATREQIPTIIGISVQNYTKPKDGERYISYATDAERNANTFEVLAINIAMTSIRGELGYLLIHYVENIIKIFETLHRKAHYASTTFR